MNSTHDDKEVDNNKSTHFGESTQLI